ncbi:aminotransferase class I/II-fold pyridoxal phosphate-dependent enzyme [Salinactinospora qingdaonensis]|uniref:Aminotransferase class I/II-fold pyridoxal phosphate-dependent enzyme n=1 Tax=Salinactinospora qingdaonensis TaxID=702744 RepID=A0ABP7G0S7_9ACTN
MDETRSAFTRLRGLLDGVAAPEGRAAIELHLGESRMAPPAVDVTPLADVDGWTRYPPLGGTAELRAAYSGWLQRRFTGRHSPHDLPIATEPTPGAKQALAVAIALAARERDAGAPAVIMPNPFYPTYRTAAAAAGARPVYYTLDTPDGVAPIAAAVEAAGGRAAAIILCTPGNPRGDILPAAAMGKVAEIAAAAGALLIVDEVYTDLALRRTPPGYLSLVAEEQGAPGRFLVVHSLSKRSAMPGLRSGFVAGDPATVAAYAAYNRSCGVSTPLPVTTVAARLWDDDDHIEGLRAALARNWQLADATLGGVYGYRRAEAGFFLWLPVADDEETAVGLWRDQGVRVMPGRYLAAETDDGTNPGAGHVRVALVHEATTMREGLTRLRHALLSSSSLRGPPREQRAGR